jgi:hypothetical protein
MSSLGNSFYLSRCTVRHDVAKLKLFKSHASRHEIQMYYTMHHSLNK